MQDLFFLPSWPLAPERIPWFAALLLLAVLAGEAVWRWLRVPRMLGWIAAGLAFGPNALGLIDRPALAQLGTFMDIAVGVILFELGQRVDLGWLARNPWLLATSILESGLAFGGMYAVLVLAGSAPLLAGTAAAIGIATAPAVILTLTRELRAQGQVTERMLALTAMSNIYGFILLSMMFAWLHAEYHGGWAAVAAHPLYLIFGSLALAALLALVTLALLVALGRRSNAQFICVVAMVVIAVWAASALKLSFALTLLGYGTMTRMFDRDRSFVSLDFGRIGQILVILLFAITAANLDLRLLPAGAATAGAYVLARYAGKALGVFVLARPSGLGVRKASLLGLGLVPMSGVALVMVHQTSALYPQMAPGLAAVVLSAVAMLELLGPLMGHFAIVRAGEAAQER